jgi:hypothetical protein
MEWQPLVGQIIRSGPVPRVPPITWISYPVISCCNRDSNVCHPATSISGIDRVAAARPVYPRQIMEWRPVATCQRMYQSPFFLQSDDRLIPRSVGSLLLHRLGHEYRISSSEILSISRRVRRLPQSFSGRQSFRRVAFGALQRNKRKVT